MRVGGEVRLPATAIGDVRVELGCGEVGVAEHLLDAAQVGPALEQVRGKRVPEKMRVDALRVEPRPLREPADDQERAGARQGPALGVQEQLGAVPPVQVGRPRAR